MSPEAAGTETRPISIFPKPSTLLCHAARVGTGPRET